MTTTRGRRYVASKHAVVGLTKLDGGFIKA